MLNSQHLAIHFCGALVHWRSRIVSALGFSSCQSVLTSGVWIHMAATSLTMPRMAWDLEIKLLTFLFSSISIPPICPDPAASCVVSKHNKEDLSADTTNTNVCGDDVHERAPVHQALVSVSFPTLLRSRVSLLLFCCSLHPHCCMDVLIQVCVCVCVCVSCWGCRGTGLAQAGTGPQALPDQQRSGAPDDLFL